MRRRFNAGSLLRIAVATASYPSRHHPQRGVFLQRDAEGLAARGHEVVCLVARNRLREPRGDMDASPHGVTVHEAPFLSLSYIRAWQYPLGAFQKWNSTRALRRLWKRAAAWKPDIVYAKFLSAAPLLPHVDADIPRVLGIGEGIDSVANRLAFFRTGELQRYLDAADVVEVKNQHVHDMLLREYDCAGKLHVAPSGVDIERFSPGDTVAARAALGIDPRSFVVVSIGPRNENKGGDRLLAACARISHEVDVQPVMVGPGWLARPGDEWTGLGVVAADRILTILRAADVFVLPSRSEGMPNALLEALAVGVPCVVGDRPYADFLDDGFNCMKVDPDGIDQLANALLRLAASEQLRQELGRASRSVAEMHSQQGRLDRLESLFQQAISNRRRA